MKWTNENLSPWVPPPSASLLVPPLPFADLLPPPLPANTAVDRGEGEVLVSSSEPSHAQDVYAALAALSTARATAQQMRYKHT